MIFAQTPGRSPAPRFSRPGRLHAAGLLLLGIAATGPAAASGAQLPPLPADPALQEAYYAWDRGDYPEALEGYLAVLDGRNGDDHRETIALLTGERFEGEEITPYGFGNVRVSPSGRHLLYEGRENGEPVTVVVDLRAPDARPTILPGVGASFVGNGAVAFLSPGSPVADREVHVRSIAGDFDQRIGLQGWIPRVAGSGTAGVLIGAPDEDAFYVSASRTTEGAPTDLLRIDFMGILTELPTGTGPLGGFFPVPGGRHLVFTTTVAPAEGGAPRSAVAVLDLESEGVRYYEGRTNPAASADGSTLALLAREGAETVLEVVSLGEELPPAVPQEVARTTMPVGAPALSPSGATLAFQGRPRDDWEIHAVPAVPGGAIRRLTNEIQHDLLPQFLDESTILSVKGEGRHRRSFLIDLESGEATRFFHNNTLRTISSEYEWTFAPGGREVFILADRDGDTISPERGVYRILRDRPVSREALRARMLENLEAERALRALGEAAFAPIAAEVAAVTTQVEVGRIYQYARTLYDMGSKWITNPGNALAIDYLDAQLRAWGYEPELQWFEPRPGVRSANVIARLPGTENPELVYVASSHFDSVDPSPGADDNSSGTTALLEAARVLRDHPQAATLEFAFFTAEEAGLLGAREYVRRAQEEGKRIVGALNNDMIGWTNDHRLDNTIRYSNAGIRDLQHGAAILFSELITYDSHYYQGTDGAALYEGFGDIVGGIGSYPVLGSPHYHQATDRLEIVNHRLVTEVSRVTVATLMRLASSPARLTGLRIASAATPGAVEVSWEAAREGSVVRYRVRAVPPQGDPEEREVGASPGEARPSLLLSGLPPGSEVAVRAVNALGLEGWDWARRTVEP